MNNRSKTSTIVLFLSCILLIYFIALIQGSFLSVLAQTNSIDHQLLVNDKPKWEQVDLPKQISEQIPNGPKIHFENSTTIDQCNNPDILMDFPNMNSVSYFSDGNTLNSTFWLSRSPLINHEWQNQSMIREINQVYLDIESINIEKYNKTFEQYVEDEKTHIDNDYFNVIIINQTNNTKISNEPATRIIFNATTNDSIFGLRNITGFDELTIRDGQLYRIRYLAEPEDYQGEKSKVEDMIESIEFMDNNNTQYKNQKSPIEKSGKIVMETYTGNGINIKYPSNWGKIERNSNNIIFFSPIDFYLIGTGYIALIDIPSIHNARTDFVAKVMWWHSLYDRKWFRVIEEVSNEGQMRILEQEPDFKEFFKNQEDWEAYAFLPINLRLINFPDQYLVVFFTEATYVKDGLLCEIVQKTDQVSIPAPKLSMSLSDNFTSLSPEESKKIEVTVKSHSDFPYNVTFQDYHSAIIDASFSPHSIQVSPSSWNTTQVTIKSNKPWNTPTLTQTLPLFANASIPTDSKGNPVSFNTNILNTSAAAESELESSSLTIRAFNLPDSIFNMFTFLQVPVAVLVPIAGGFAAIIAWILKRKKGE